MIDRIPSYIEISSRYAVRLVLALWCRPLTTLQLNILISDTGEALLSDFGLSFVTGCFDPSLQEDRTVGTLRYMAPELLVEGRGAASMKTDIWALGMTILEVTAFLQT